MKRRWRDFPGRFRGQLDATAGILGVGGIGLGATGWGVLAAPFATAALAFGGVISVGTLAYCVYRAIPPKLVDASETVGKQLLPSDLETLATQVPMVSIVGASEAGKTTLRNRLQFVPERTVKTDTVSAVVVSFPGAMSKHIAILDGGGHKYQQQFDLAEKSQHMVIVLDHNASDVNKDVDEARLAKHREFLEHIANSIRDYRKEKLQSILFLWNKRDLWQEGGSNNTETFIAFIRGVQDDWEKRDYARKVAARAHSNEKPDDIAFVVNYLRGLQPLEGI